MGEAGPSAWAEALKVGDLVDCLDKARRWRAARIAAVTADGKLTISFKGWSSKHDDDVARASKRLDKPGSHTAGQDTRAVAKQGEAFVVDLEVVKLLELRIDDYISGDFPAEERVRAHLSRARAWRLLSARGGFPLRGGPLAGQH